MRRPLQLLVLAVEHVVLEKESLRPGFTTARGHASGDNVHQRRGHVQHPRTMTIVHRGPRHRCNSARSRCEIATSQMHAQDVIYRRSCQTTKCHLCCLDLPAHLLFSVHISLQLLVISAPFGSLPTSPSNVTTTLLYSQARTARMTTLPRGKLPANIRLAA